MKIVPTIIACACLLFLCSCATVNQPPPPIIVGTPIVPATQLPPPQDIDSNVGHEARTRGMLSVTIGLEDGRKLPFIIDTGSPITFFDKSLESKLGKCLGTVPAHRFDSVTTAKIYSAPKLYLDGVPLMTDSNILTMDMDGLRRATGTHIMGILGMDCLKYYCIQLDFEAHKMRFLDSSDLNTNQLGRAFPLIYSVPAPRTNAFYLHIKDSDFFGEEVTNWVIDTGCLGADGGIEPQFFQQEIRKPGVQLDRPPYDSRKANAATFRELTWNGQIYTNLFFSTWPAGVGFLNLIGLNFLARHLVTFDFPDRVMYLKQRSIGTLDDQQQYLALEFLMGLKRQGREPGWARDEDGTVNVQPDKTYFNTFDIQGQKNGDSTVYHYLVTCRSGNMRWILVKAWQADATGKVIKEYSLK